VNNDVEVKAGDKVVDVNGDIVELANGVKVKDAAGNEVEFTGSPITMKQMGVTYKFIPGITWSDGKPLVKADFELGYKTTCDRENGATSFITCDRTLAITFDSDTQYTVTWVPGVQDGSSYFLAPYGAYPSHQVIESEGAYKGKTLAEVPAKDWPTLPEIAEKPLGFGPYVLKEWVKGEKMVFEANPYYVLGVPKTPNIVIAFITPENAEAQLLGGQVDVLDSTTLVGVTQTLADAAAAGKVVLLVNPSATWEHIDFNLFVK
jgi:ABC-type transport system substrate-binding protein